MTEVSAEDLIHLIQLGHTDQNVTDLFTQMRDNMSPAEWILYEEQVQKCDLEEWFDSNSSQAQSQNLQP